MQKSDLNYLHRKTLDDLKAAILTGVLLPGEKFYSRGELCRKFGLSSSMAHRIQSELQAANYILPQCGSKFIVNAVSNPDMNAPRNLKKVLFIGDCNALTPGSYGAAIVDGVREACESHGLEFEEEQVHVLNKSANYINTRRSLGADTGVVLILTSELSREVMSLLLDLDLPLVTVNSYFPHRSAVLADFRLAAAQLLQETVVRGAKKVMYCSNFDLNFCPIIADARERAFAEYSKFFNLEYMIANSGNFYQLCRRINNFKPDVLLFQNDIWAMHFKSNFLAKCSVTPLIFGCDNFYDGEGKIDFTTWDTCPAAQGRTAVEVLLNPRSTFKPFVTHIKGKLIVRY